MNNHVILHAFDKKILFHVDFFNCFSVLTNIHASSVFFVSDSINACNLLTAFRKRLKGIGLSK